MLQDDADIDGVVLCGGVLLLEGLARLDRVWMEGLGSWGE